MYVSVSGYDTILSKCFPDNSKGNFLNSRLSFSKTKIYVGTFLQLRHFISFNKMTVRITFFLRKFHEIYAYFYFFAKTRWTFWFRLTPRKRPFNSPKLHADDVTGGFRTILLMNCSYYQGELFLFTLVVTYSWGELWIFAFPKTIMKKNTKSRIRDIKSDH